MKTLGDLTHPVAYRVLYCTLRQGGSSLKEQGRESLGFLLLLFCKKFHKININPLYFFGKVCYNRKRLYLRAYAN